MAYQKKVWKNRLSEFPNRRRLEPTGIENTYDVVRVEGNVTEIGDPFAEESMNDLEDRIAEGLAEGAITTALHARTGTVNNLDIPDGAKNLTFLATADLADGDTWTVNGQPVTAVLQNGEALPGELFKSGCWVTGVYWDGAKLNFKSAGGSVKWNILYGKDPTSTSVVDGALLLPSINTKPDVLFDYVPPVSPAENMIYVGYYPATVYRKCYPLQKTKNLSYAISGVKQYSGGKWKVIDAYVGESGQWKQVSWATHYIYVSTRGVVEKWSQDGTLIWRTQINSQNLYKDNGVSICACRPKGVVYVTYSYAGGNNGTDGCIAVLDMYTGTVLQRYAAQRSIDFIVIDAACTTLRTNYASYALNSDGTISSLTETSYALAEFDKASNEWALGDGTTLYRGNKAAAFAGNIRLHLYPGKYIHSGATGGAQDVVYSNIELTTTGRINYIGCILSRLWDYNRAGDLVGIGYSTYGGKVIFSTCNSSGLVSTTPYKALAIPFAPHHLAVTPDDTVFAISYDGTNKVPKLFRIDLDNTITEIPGVLNGLYINYTQCGIASDPGPRSAFYDLW